MNKLEWKFNNETGGDWTTSDLYPFRILVSLDTLNRYNITIETQHGGEMIDNWIIDPKLDKEHKDHFDLIEEDIEWWFSTFFQRLIDSYKEQGN